VKFQTHIASAESTPAEPFRVQFSRQDATRYDYWKRMEFTEKDGAGSPNTHASAAFCSCRHRFPIQAVELLERIGMPLWKIRVGETSNDLLLDRILDTGRPVLLSTGMSPSRRSIAPCARSRPARRRRRLSSAPPRIRARRRRSG
jgi:N-acetylneuraminate synthase